MAVVPLAPQDSNDLPQAFPVLAKAVYVGARGCGAPSVAETGMHLLVGPPVNGDIAVDGNFERPHPKALVVVLGEVPLHPRTVLFSSVGGREERFRIGPATEQHNVLGVQVEQSIGVVRFESLDVVFANPVNRFLSGVRSDGLSRGQAA